MSGKMQLTAKLDQRLAMNQQLRQAITLLQYNTIELKQYVQQCIEQNPLIEVEEMSEQENTDTTISHDEEEYYQPTHEFSYASKNTAYQGDESQLENISSPKTLREYLREQTLLCKFKTQEQVIAEAIIDAIDDNGFLSMSLEEIHKAVLEEIPVNVDVLNFILNTIQQFDPPGVGARNIQESLLIQLEFIPKKDATWEIAKKIVQYSFEKNAINNAVKIIKKLHLTQEEFIDAMNLIKTLNPNPGKSYSSEININIEPELYVKKVKDKWCVFLADSLLTNVKINNQYRELIRQSKNHGSYGSLNKELQEAQWLLKGLKRRNETLLLVAEYIIELQKDFLEHGPSHMKPLNNTDVAQAIEMHESTISRITTGKYISTPRGIYELKYFFPTQLANQSGSICSDTAVKQLIQEIIEKETGDKTYSDNEIVTLLKEKGVNIARRTVAKYREAMDILPSYQRAKLQFNT